MAGETIHCPECNGAGGTVLEEHDSGPAIEKCARCNGTCRIDKASYLAEDERKRLRYMLSELANDESHGVSSYAIAIRRHFDAASPRAVEALLIEVDELVAACRLATCELSYLIEQTKSRPGGSVDKAFRACKGVLAKYPRPKRNG